MTISKRDHAQLLSRARAALETPDDLDAAAVRDLIEDLASGEEAVKTHAVPWPVDIHVAEIDHRHGTNVYVALSREGLMRQVAAFCRECWSSTDDPRDPKTLSDEETASAYFEQDDEFLSTHCISCSPTPFSGVDAHGNTPIGDAGNDRAASPAVDPAAALNRYFVRQRRAMWVCMVQEIEATDEDAAIDYFHDCFDPQHRTLESAVQRVEHGPVTVFDRAFYPRVSDAIAAD